MSRDPTIIGMWLNFETISASSSGVTMGWLLRLMTGGPTGKGAPTVPEFLMINLNVCVCCDLVTDAKKRSLSRQLVA